MKGRAYDEHLKCKTQIGTKNRLNTIIYILCRYNGEELLSTKLMLWAMVLLMNIYAYKITQPLMPVRITDLCHS